jgi:hypothetical protein
MAKRAISFVYTRKPPPARVEFETWRTDVRGRLARVSDSHLKSRRKAVANWSAKTKPEFAAKTQVNLYLISIEITVKEKDRKRPIWKWIDETGTKRHIIRPKKRGGLLAFPWGGPGSYQAKTGANPARFGGPGTVRNPIRRFTRFVNHPGFERRGISDAINRDLEKVAYKEIENATRQDRRRVR